MTSSPSDVLSVTVVTYSRGSELSIVNGTRTDLPATPKVGTSRLEQLDVGQPGPAAHRHGEHRHALDPQPGGGLHRRRALVPVAVGGQHDPAQVGDPFRRAGQRLVKVGAVAGSGSRPALDRPADPGPIGRRRERLDDDVHPLPQIRPRTRGRPAAPPPRVRVVAEDVGWSAATTSRVSMLGEASQSTAIVGFSSGRNSSIHSGWLSSTATIATSASRSSSSRPIETR